MPATLTSVFVADMVELFTMNSSGAIGAMPEKLAKGITDAYIKAIKDGVNPVINNKIMATFTSPTSPNVIAFKSCLLNAYTTAMTDITSTGSVANSILKAAFMQAPILFWTGVMLEGVFKGMPPGHVGLVPAISIINVGVVPPINIPSHGAPMPPPAFFTAVATAWTAHLASLTFFCPALFLPSPAPPYPMALTAII